MDAPQRNALSGCAISELDKQFSTVICPIASYVILGLLRRYDFRIISVGPASRVSVLNLVGTSGSTIVVISCNSIPRDSDDALTIVVLIPVDR